MTTFEFLELTEEHEPIIIKINELHNVLIEKILKISAKEFAEMTGPLILGIFYDRSLKDNNYINDTVFQDIVAIGKELVDNIMSLPPKVKGYFSTMFNGRTLYKIQPEKFKDYLGEDYIFFTDEHKAGIINWLFGSSIDFQYYMLYLMTTIEEPVLDKVYDFIDESLGET